MSDSGAGSNRGRINDEEDPDSNDEYSTGVVVNIEENINLKEKS